MCVVNFEHIAVTAAVGVVTKKRVQHEQQTAAVAEVAAATLHKAFNVCVCVVFTVFVFVSVKYVCAFHYTKMHICFIYIYYIDKWKENAYGINLSSSSSSSSFSFRFYAMHFMVLSRKNEKRIFVRFCCWKWGAAYSKCRVVSMTAFHKVSMHTPCHQLSIIESALDNDSMHAKQQ